MAGLKYRISSQEAKNVKDALVYSKFKSPGILARLLLESFIFEDGDINSDWFVREKACEKGNFTKIRDRLIEEKFIHFREDSRRYFAGSRLNPYLDALKLVKWATIADLALKADLSELRELDAKKADRIEYNVTKMELELVREKLANTVMELKTVKENLANTDMELKTVKENLAITDERISKVENSMESVYAKLELGEPDPPFYVKLQRKIGLKDDENLKH